MQPVSPDEAMKPKPSDVAAAVKRVDEGLRHQWTTWERRDGRTIQATLLGNEPKSVVAAFEAVGWTVKYTDDQRDGAFYRFSCSTTSSGPASNRIRGLRGQLVAQANQARALATSWEGEAYRNSRAGAGKDLERCARELRAIFS